MSKLLLSLATPGLAIIALVQCSPGPGAQGTIGYAPVSAAVASMAVRARAREPVVYAAYHDSVVAYSAASGTIVRTLTGLSNPSALAVDRDGSLYVLNSAGQRKVRRFVTEFAPGASTPERTIANVANSGANPLAARAGTLYVLENGGISEYGPGETSIGKTLHPEDRFAWYDGFALGPSNALAASEWKGQGSPIAGFVAKYGRAGHLLHRSTTGAEPTSVAIDGGGDIFVAGTVGARGSYSNAVIEYSPALAKLHAIVLPGPPRDFVNIATDDAGRLYVLLPPARSGPWALAVYAPGSTEPTLSVAVRDPQAMAVDLAGDVFLIHSTAEGGCSPCTLAEIASGSSTMRTLATIRSGDGFPVTAIALGSLQAATE